MKHGYAMLICLTLLIITVVSPLLADNDPSTDTCIIDSEFADTGLLYAPLSFWVAAGSNAVIDSVLSMSLA